MTSADTFQPVIGDTTVDAAATFFAGHSGHSPPDLNPEAVRAAREVMARVTAAANILRYVMWLIGTKIDLATARPQQVTVNALSRIRDEFGMLSATEAGHLLDPRCRLPGDQNR